MIASAQPSRTVVPTPIAEPCHALQLFDHLPAGCMAFTVADRSCEPLIMPGEIAVIDIASEELRRPDEGALYLRSLSSRDGMSRLRIVGLTRMQRRLEDDDGEFRMTDCWFFQQHNRPREVSAESYRAWSAEFGPVPLACGPWVLDHPTKRNPRPLETIVGRVVGILVGVIASNASGRA